MEKAIRVLIADDHPTVRAGVRVALEEAEFEIVAEVGDADRAVEAAVAHRPDVCVLDILMPGSGISAAQRISAEVPDAVLVMLTVSRNDSDLFEALRAGATGYLLKDTDPDRLPLALKAAMKGEAALPRGLVTKLVNEFRSRGRRGRLTSVGPNGVELTNREWEVLDHMRAGLSTQEIANRLFVSPVTVRTHVSAILRKLRVPDRAAALVLMDATEND
jgi:DNA-binding NarL/FixJ family response regulator